MEGLERPLSSLLKEVRNAVVDRAYQKCMKKMIELGLVIVKGSGRWRISATEL